MPRAERDVVGDRTRASIRVPVNVDQARAGPGPRTLRSRTQKTNTKSSVSQRNGRATNNRKKSSAEKEAVNEDDTYTLTRIVDGDCPPVTEWARTIPDLNSRFLYRYGGSVDSDAVLGRRFEDINYVPTNSIFKFDIENKSWTNLTDKIVFDPEGRFEFSNDPLPAIYGPSSTMVRFDGPANSPRDFIFLFGGKREGRRGDTTSAELIFIDVVEQKWGVSRVAGGTVPNRIGASMVCLDKKLFIFGGESDDGPPGDPTPKPLQSYCILEYSLKTWRWVHKDVAYDDKILKLNIPTAFGSATYDPWNRMILLGPGLGYGDRQFQQPYDLVERNFVYFHPINRTMRPIPATSLLGEIKTFPQKQSSYVLSYNDRNGGPTGAHPIPPPQVLIAAWSVPKQNVPSTPEIWQYFVPPTEELQCLGVRAALAKLGVEFVTFAAMGGRVVLLGYDQPKRADARLDICIELEDLGKIAALELKRMKEVKMEVEE